MSLESNIESHTASAYLGICLRLPRSPTAAHDTVVRIKATVWGGVQKKCVSMQTNVYEVQQMHHCMGGCEQVVMDQ